MVLTGNGDRDPDELDVGLSAAKEEKKRKPTSCRLKCRVQGHLRGNGLELSADCQKRWMNTVVEN